MRYYIFIAVLLYNISCNAQMFFGHNQPLEEDTTSFIMEVSVTAGLEFTMPFFNTTGYDCTIDWGDGSLLSEITTYNDPDRIHTYTNAGNYDIKINGTCKGISFIDGNINSSNSVVSIKQWGYVNFSTFYGAFYGCRNLTNTVSPITGVSLVTNYSYFFSRTGFTNNLPSDLFLNSSAALDCSGLLEGCNDLSSLPSGFFDYFTNATDFTSVVNICVSLSTLPAGLLDNCTSALSFSNAFRWTNLSSLPSGLFDFCVNATNFESVFSLSPLSSFPTGIFDNTTSATNFIYAFGDCSSMTGNADDLWNDYPSADGTVCFNGCTSLSNFASIPSDWK